jgi:hypothetical protein
VAGDTTLAGQLPELPALQLSEVAIRNSRRVAVKRPIANVNRTDTEPLEKAVAAVGES